MEDDRSNDIISVKSMARDFFIWTSLGLVLVKLRGVIFTKIFSIFLGAADYGYFFFIQNTGLAIASLINFNMSVAVYRFTSETIAQKDESKSFLTLLTSIFMSLGIALGINMLIIIATLFRLNLFTSETYFIDIIAMGVFGTIVAIDNILLAYYRSKQDKEEYFLLETIIPYITLIGSIVLGIFLNLTVIGLILAHILGYLILILPLLFKFIFKAKRLKIDLREARRILEFSLPGFFVIILASIKVLIFNLLLKELHGDVSLGIYSVAFGIANIFGMFDYLVSLSYPTIILRNYDLQNHDYIQRFVARMTRIYITMMIAFTFFLSAFSPLLVLIFSSSEFLESAVLVPVILIALIFQASGRLTCFGPLIKKQTKAAGITNAISNLTHLAVLIILIPLLGSLGAVISILIFHIVTLMLNFRLSQSLYKINYEKMKFIGIGFVSLLSFLIGILFLQFNQNLIYTSFGVSCIMFVFLVFLLRLVELHELKRILATIILPFLERIKTQE